MRGDDLHADRQPVGRAPAGTEIAGQPVTVMRYAERIQSRYDVIGLPLISVGNSSSTGNGGTWETGSTSTSWSAKKRRIAAASRVRRS